MEASASEVREVSFEEALAEENDSIDQAEAPRPRPGDSTASEAPPEPVAAKEQAKEDLEILVSMAEAKERTFGPENAQRSYIQRELSVIGKTQWFSLVGEILDKALGGENSISLNGLLSPPTVRAGQPSISDFQDADTFVHAVGKLMAYAPEFMSKSVCIWLSVPDFEWELVRDLMSLSPEIGGMSDEMFEDIFATFIDQNYKSIDSFFRERYPRLRNRWTTRAREAEQSRSSKR